jgi:hypothetical protein
MTFQKISEFFEKKAEILQNATVFRNNLGYRETPAQFREHFFLPITSVKRQAEGESLCLRIICSDATVDLKGFKRQSVFLKRHLYSTRGAVSTVCPPASVDFIRLGSSAMAGVLSHIISPKGLGIEQLKDMCSTVEQSILSFVGLNHVQLV